MSRFAFSDVQAQAILDMRLQRLTALEADKVRAEHADLIERIGDDKLIFASDYPHWDGMFPYVVSTIRERHDLSDASKRKILGDILAIGGEDPYLWASKLHFYITGITFYNFPYTFGYLLSRGLYQMFKMEGRDFLPKFEELLRLAGRDTVENVVQRTVGQNLEKQEFWDAAIRSLEQPLSRLQMLLSTANSSTAQYP